jgi:hypothetical protein
MEEILEGRTQQQIAISLGISQPAVSKIARRVEERLLADVAFKADRQRARQTLRLEHIYGEAMRAWQDSKQEGLRRRQRKTEGESGVGSTVAELISENRNGDPRYLDEARKALTDLRKVWGVDAPERLTIDAMSLFTSMSDEALDVELTRHLRLVQPLPSATEIKLGELSDTQRDDHDNQHEDDHQGHD